MTIYVLFVWGSSLVIKFNCPDPPALRTVVGALSIAMISALSFFVCFGGSRALAQ